MLAFSTDSLANANSSVHCRLSFYTKSYLKVVIFLVANFYFSQIFKMMILLKYNYCRKIMNIFTK